MQPNRDFTAELPEPDAASRTQCERVAAYLETAISDAGGSISFGEFMQHALYAPGLGYYSAGTKKFGPGGDFVTAPELSPLFGNVLARRIAPLFAADGSLQILELGPGSGALPVQLLAKLEELDALPARYRILEVSADLAARQRARLETELAHLAPRVEWLRGLPRRFAGVVVANEVLDALPVERFVRRAEGVDQLRVVRDGAGFAFTRAPAPGWLADAVAAIERGLGRALPEGYVSELSPGIAGWIDDLTACLDTAAVFLFDYGLARHEYYAPDRSGGWLRCHYRHRAHEDPLRYPGIQDLSAWVDFTGVAEAAVTAGLEVAGYFTQSRFLLDGGLTEELEGLESANAAERVDLSRQVKVLTLPGEMGEHVKCLVLSRGKLALEMAQWRGDRSHAL